MSINVDRYQFNGPFANTDDLYDISGVYVILDAGYHVIDVGESAQIKTRITYHDRKACWTRNSRGRLWVATFYAPERDRMAIERELRITFQPICGQR